MNEKPQYGWRYDYDAIGDPPKIYITHDHDGRDLLEVFLDPIPKDDIVPYEDDRRGENEFWIVPEAVLSLVELLNENEWKHE